MSSRWAERFIRINDIPVVPGTRDVLDRTSRWHKHSHGVEVAVSLFGYPTPQGYEKRWHWLFRRIGDDQIYYQPMLSQTILTASPGTQQTITSDATWNNANNTVEGIGGGGSGGNVNAASGRAAGGAGGAYAKIANFVFATPGTTTAGYQIGSGGAAVSLSATGATAGNNGGNTWFNATAFATGTTNAQCNAAGGLGGAVNNTSGAANGGAAGATGWGQTINAGGRGGNAPGTTTQVQGAGGGGAGGPNGAGAQGVDIASGVTNTSSAGGQGDGTSGGAAGAAAGNGGNGTEWTSTAGSGGGGGGNSGSANSVNAGNGGNYGAGGGGVNNVKTSGTHTSLSGLGTQGILVLTWTPVVATNLTANNIASAAAGLDTPALTTTYALTAANLAAGAAGLDTPAFSQTIVLTASNLAAGAAGIGSPLANSRLYVADAALDNGLNAFLLANRITLCSTQPLNYTDANTTYKIGDRPMGIGGVIASGPSNASPDGRAVVTNAVTGGNISTAGTGAAWAILDDANSRLLASGPLSPSIAFITTDGWNLASMQINVRAASP